MGSLKVRIMAYRGSGSRYPSAYGHTPSYRSVNSLPGASYESSHMTTSPSSTFTSGLGRDIARDVKFDIDREMRAFDAPLTTSSGLGGATGSSSSSKKVSSYSSSSYSSSSTGDGKRPVVESSYDSNYRSSNTGASGVPHTSYASTSSSYSSENPYKNRVSSFSYNI